jgi:hypothetical protein
MTKKIYSVTNYIFRRLRDKGVVKEKVQERENEI